MAAAGNRAEETLARVVKDHKGIYIAPRQLRAARALHQDG